MAFDYTLMDNFDICIIGAGPAGIAAAIRAWDFGKKVCIIERKNLGGAGLHNGALSSKTLWELSRDYRNATQKDRGFIAKEVHADLAHVVQCVEGAIREKLQQLEKQFQQLRSPTSDHPGSIEVIQGNARFETAETVFVKLTTGGLTKKINAKNFIIATGSRPRHLDSIDVDGKLIMTSDHLMAHSHFPKSLVIVGAGVVGCEFATILANYGKTKIYLIDKEDRILPFEDDDISNLCSTNLESKGVTIHHKAKLISIKKIKEKIDYTFEHPNRNRQTNTVENALISIGRVPNTEDLNLEGIGLELSDRGYVRNHNTRTSVPNIYAVGDITWDTALVNIAEIEGRYAVEKIYDAIKTPISYKNQSTIMFLDPEVAAVGLNEQQAQKKKIPYRVAVYGYKLVNRAVAMRNTDGFVKLLVTDDDEMHILGMRALGVHASTTIESVSLMIQQNRPVRDLAELIHPHPAITEGLQECVRMLLGKSIYKPHVFPSELRLSRVTND